MPITVTFDLPGSTNVNDRNRIRVVFERLGWEVMGGTAYRYPRFGSENVSEDWFNHVIPALMYLRALCENRDVAMEKFTIDASASAGLRSGGAGAEMKSSKNLELYTPSSNESVLTEKRLREWLESCATSVVG